jgi:hypothetical protein
MTPTIKPDSQSVESNIKVENYQKNESERGILISRESPRNTRGQYSWRPMVVSIATGTVLSFGRGPAVSPTQQLLRAFLILLFLASNAILMLYALTFSMTILRKRKSKQG